MAESRDEVPSTWSIRPSAGSCRWTAFHLPQAAGAHGPRRPLRAEGRHRLRRDDRGLRRAAPRPHRKPGSTAPIQATLSRDSTPAAYAHSVECWSHEGELVGGLYGVALGGAFFGESMMSRERDASKVALAHLVARLRAGGFTAARRAVRHRAPGPVRNRRDFAVGLQAPPGRRARGRGRLLRLAVAGRRRGGPAGDQPDVVDPSARMGAGPASRSTSSRDRPCGWPRGC